MNNIEETNRSESNNVVIAAMYKFVSFPNFEDWRDRIYQNMLDNDVKGTLLIAHEGINGTVASSDEGIKNLLAFLESIPNIGKIGVKYSYSDEVPFNRSKVKLKKEIVTMGVTDIDPSVDAGQYVKPEDWNDLISQDDVILIDTRNEYEYRVGTFKNAINPHTDTFREFPEFVKKNLDPNKHKKVAMFCTGGIRCEKSTSYLKKNGFDEVYHLQGGILQYFEDVDTEESLWDGECFVFDSRVTVDQELKPGKYDQCYACREPLTQQDKRHEHYVHGLSCHHCYDKTTEEQKQSFYERQKQIRIAKEAGLTHIGGDVKEQNMKRRQEKIMRKNRDTVDA